MSSRKKGGRQSFYVLFLLEGIGIAIITPNMLMNSHPSERVGMVVSSSVLSVAESTSPSNNVPSEFIPSNSY
jgi:hypothetical protein